MASYDSPGYSATLPLAGWESQDSRLMTAPGSPPAAGAPAGPAPSATDPVVSTPYTGERGPRVAVAPADVNVPNQAPAADPVSGVSGIDRTGAGDGHVNHFAHPNGGPR
jgi:hypothetical protein